MDELEAVRERTLDPALVPALLRTAAYAEAVARASDRITGEDRASWTAAEHADRQRSLTRPDPIEHHALIDEAALRRPVGGPDVRRAQLDHLVAMAARPTVTIQVIPYSAGAYAALAGAVVLLDFAEADEPLAGYLEAPVTGVAPVADREVGLVSKAWDDAARQALTAAESARFLRALRDTP